jgi:hypothetical protein
MFNPSNIYSLRPCGMMQAFIANPKVSPCGLSCLRCGLVLREVRLGISILSRLSQRHQKHDLYSPQSR